ncbi:MAG TPA: hypothetical protein VG753_00390, partial [Candidatus Paceibacterota bacterium]|nr:hypothetical protein [Candidatus Paceibacterota bacterium]
MNIRYVLGTLSLLTAFLSFASVASASTTNLSFDPSYASQPFFYSCDPYKAGFENGKHYQPLATPNCLYTIPSTVLGGSKIIALYKGTPGNSTFVAGDQVIGGSPTLVQENSTTFAGATQDQDYFAVVYGYSSTAEANTFDQSFRTGSSTDINPPTGNFAMIQWKWGGKPASEYNPVVIVPDILNSWQTDSGSVIDPIFLTNKNLIDTLTSNGYVNGQTLFLFPYNWEEPAASTATELQNTIASIKATCGCSHVDIIAHGTGGLIAEQYIESAGYGNDVDQIVFLGTPLQGLPAAYSAWEDGKINFNSPLSDGLAQVFLQAQANTQGYANTFDFVQHAPVQSFKDILPDYDYLYDNSVGERVYPSGYPVNSFLDNLISNLSLLLNRVRITTVLGDDNQGTTPSAYLLGTSTTPPAWPDGQITDTFPDLGDELVPRASIENVVNPVSDVVAADHRDLPTAAEGFIFNSLTNKVASTVANNYPVGCALFITTTPGADLQVTDPNGNHLGKDFTNNVVLSEIPHSLYSGWSVPTEYAVIANPLNGNYQVRTQGTTNTSFTINASDVCNQGVISTSTPANTSPGQLIGFSLGVSTSTNTLTIQPLDINPPVITITSPLNGNSYYQNATTSVAATIVDPENSPIATSTYKINGALINPTQALKFSTLPLGTSTLVVSATDI